MEKKDTVCLRIGRWTNLKYVYNSGIRLKGLRERKGNFMSWPVSGQRPELGTQNKKQELQFDSTKYYCEKNKMRKESHGSDKGEQAPLNRR
jgi:hypothetical protein